MLVARRGSGPTWTSCRCSPKASTTCPIWSTWRARQGLAVRATLTEDEEEVLRRERPTRSWPKPTPSCASARSTTCCDRASRSSIRRRTYIEPEVEIEPDAIDPARAATCAARRALRATARSDPTPTCVDTRRSAPARACGSRCSRARTVGERVSIGPFSHLRPGAVIEDDVDARQLRRSQSQPRRRGHPDAPLQLRRRRRRRARVNIGAGTITVNFSSETRRQEPHDRRATTPRSAATRCSSRRSTSARAR